MKMQITNFQLREQDKYPERTDNVADLTSLLEPEFKEEVIKCLIK